MIIEPMHVEDGAALSMEDAVTLGVVTDYPARYRQQDEAITPLPLDPAEEAVPLPVPASNEPEDLDNTAPATPASRAAATHQATNQEAKRERASNGKLCPVHHTAKPSHYGGLYCPRGDAEQRTGYCQWTSKTAKKEEAA